MTTLQERTPKGYISPITRLHNADRSITLRHGASAFMVIANDHGGAFRVRMYDPRTAPGIVPDAITIPHAGRYVGETVADVVAFHRTLQDLHYTANH